MNVKEFLERFKKAAKESGLDVVPTKDNMNALIDLRITRKIRKEIIFKLKEGQYYSGPVQDRDRPGEVWIFRVKYDGIVIYTKLKLTEKDYGDKAKCLSFHRAKFSMDKKEKININKRA